MEDNMMVVSPEKKPSTDGTKTKHPPTHQFSALFPACVMKEEKKCIKLKGLSWWRWWVVKTVEHWAAKAGRLEVESLHKNSQKNRNIFLRNIFPLINWKAMNIDELHEALYVAIPLLVLGALPGLCEWTWKTIQMLQASSFSTPDLKHFSEQKP